MCIRDRFRYAAPLMGSLILLFLATNAPPFLVIGSVGADLFNVFNAANGFRILALSLPTAIVTPLFPYIAALHVRRQYEAIRQRTWQALRFTALVVVPVVIALAVYRVNFLNIFYVAQYVREGAVPLAILALSAVPLALSQIIGTVLSAIGQQRLEFYLTSVQVAVLFVSAFLLLPTSPGHPYFLGYFGLDGLLAASIAILLSSIAALVLNAAFMHRLLAVRIGFRSTGLILLSALASFLAVSRLNSVIPVSRFYLLFGAVALGFAVYFLVLAATGELSKQDVRRLVAGVGLPPSVASFLARFCRRESTPDVAPAAPGEARGLRPLGDEEPSSSEPAPGEYPPPP